MSEDPISIEDAMQRGALLQLLEHGAPDVMALSSADGSYLWVSEVAGPMLGWQPPDMVGRPVDTFVHPDDVPAARLARAAALQSLDVVIAEQRMQRRDGSSVWTEVAMRRVDDPCRPEASALIASIRDITDRKLVEARLERLALTDPLTGVANRTVLLDRMTHALRRLGRQGSVVGVVYLDVDRFKVINDSMGHKLGDQLLVQVAERVLRVIRPKDTLARIGGDEFVIVAEDLSDLSQATALAERVRAAVSEPFDLGGEHLYCTISAGVTATADQHHGAQAMLQEADLALYRAKDGGRNRTDVFDEELRRTAIGRLDVEQTLRRAIDGDGLRVHYQPIIDLRTGHPTAAEALVRIQDETRGLMLPGDFLAVAEETGLLVAIDEWMLRQVAAQAERWRREQAIGIDGVTLNITARHLSSALFTSALRDAIEDHGLPPGSLSIELTERVLMEAPNAAMDALRSIRALGVGIGLDDFGTGYSSLAYLRQFPLDFVKVDRSLVAGVGGKKEERALVTAIIDLAHALHLGVVAEGVETEEQRRVLTELGCDRGQGHLFSPAGDVAAVTERIRPRPDHGG